MTRRRGFRIFNHHSSSFNTLDFNSSSEGLLLFDSDIEGDYEEFASTNKYPSKRRTCCDVLLHLPNTSRFKNNTHSRILRRFPFLIEMFYWIINYAFYRFTSIASQKIFARTGIWNVAQAHGIAVLEVEEYSILSFLFPFHERQAQQWFMHGHQDALTVLNKAYALVHIPGTVG